MNIELQTTYTHELLGRLAITVMVTKDGEFYLESIRLRFRRASYAHYSFYTIHFWRNDHGCWALNYWHRDWSNGRYAESGGAAKPITEDMKLFMPMLEDFVNSFTMNQIADRPLRQWQQQIAGARRQLKVGK